MLGQGARREGGERGQAQPFAFAGSSGEMARDGRGKLCTWHLAPGARRLAPGTGRQALDIFRESDE